jgi:hypothetical protein
VAKSTARQRRSTKGRWVTRKEAAALAGVSYNTIRNWTAGGEIKTRREGRVEQIWLPDLLVRSGGPEPAATPPAVDTAPSDGEAAPRSGAQLPVRREDWQRVMDKALGADEWAHRAGVAESKASQLADRLRELRSERDAAHRALEEARGELTAALRERDASFERLHAAEDRNRQLQAVLSRRQRRALGLGEFAVETAT